MFSLFVCGVIALWLKVDGSNPARVGPWSLTIVSLIKLQESETEPVITALKDEKQQPNDKYVLYFIFNNCY